MFGLDSLRSKYLVVCIFACTASVAGLNVLAAEKLSLGKPATAEEIRGWDIDIRPDGKGLPVGSGDAVSGEDVFIQKCAACHGEFAEGAGRYPVLAGGQDSLNTHDPVKTVGSYWPYASTVFDYIRRAMPFGHAQSLSADEVYAMTAYILYSNDIIEDDYVLDQNTLAAVEMPNSNGFIEDARPDVPTGEPCMKNCLTAAPKVIGKARQIDVTPEDESAGAAVAVSASDGGGFVRGKAAFAQCVACHSVVDGENKFGPTLHALIGRKIGGVEGFSNYSNAMRNKADAWSIDNLRAFLSNPQSFVPGTSMPFAGMQDEAVLEDLLVYLTAPDTGN